MRLFPWAPMFAAPTLAIAAYAFALGALLASQREERRSVRRNAVRDVEMDAALAMGEPPPRSPPACDDGARATADARVAAAVRRAAAAEARAAEAETSAAAYREAYEQQAARERASSPHSRHDGDIDGDGAVLTPTAARDARPDERSGTDSDDGWERMSRTAVACMRCGGDASQARYAAVPCGHHPLCAACAAPGADACAVCGEPVALALLLRD
jgi:hypothetical protein